VMEYVDGRSLQQIVDSQGRLEVGRATHYIAQSALGLQHAHEAGMVHRDIKPGNLLLDRVGTVRVLDMGLARLLHDDDKVTQNYDRNSVLGTADYLAPEQAQDSHAADIRSEIYSLGATFYFLLTGAAPYAGATLMQKLIWHQTKPHKPVSEHRDDVPEGLEAVLDRMLAKDPDERFQTPAEVAQALIPWIPAHVPPPSLEEIPPLSPALAGSNDTMLAGGPLTPQNTAIHRGGPLTVHHLTNYAVPSIGGTGSDRKSVVDQEGDAPKVRKPGSGRNRKPGSGRTRKSVAADDVVLTKPEVNTLRRWVYIAAGLVGLAASAVGLIVAIWMYIGWMGLGPACVV
jgi:serine/threonine protein kinase